MAGHPPGRLRQQGSETRVDSPAGTWLFVLPWDIDSVGGINQVVANLYRLFDKDGRYRPALLVTSGHAAAEHGGDTRTLRLYVKSPYSGGGARAILSYLATLPASLIQLHRWLSANRVTVVNMHGSSLTALSFALLRALGLYRGRLILSFHGFDILQAEQETGFRRQAWRLIVAMSDALVAVSENSRLKVASLWPAARCVVIHNGIDPEYFLEERDRNFDLPPDLREKVLLVSIGTFEPKKGQDVLIRAFELLAQARPEIHLLIVGRSTDYRAVLEKQIAERGLSGRITLLSDLPHSRIGTILSRARLFVLPSREEQFGIVLLEAGLYRLPVVATAVGGIPEVIVDGTTGRLVPPEQAPALANAISELLDDVPQGQRLGEALERHVRATYSWSKACEAYRALCGPADGGAHEAGTPRANRSAAKHRRKDMPA